MTTSRLTRLTGARWLRIGILVLVVAATAAAWLTRSGDRPALAIAHLSIDQIELQLYEELKAIHGGEICSVSEESMHEADGYSAELVAEHENGVPSERAIARFEESEHSFDQVDDVHIAGSSVTFVSYAEDRDSVVVLNGGVEAHGNVAVMRALSGGAAGDRWEFSYRAGYTRCDPLE